MAPEYGDNGAVVTTHLARRVLQALAAALPDEGNDVLTGVEIRDSWGSAVLVRIHTLHDRSPDGLMLANDLRAAAEEALEGHRHRVEIAWGSLG